MLLQKKTIDKIFINPERNMKNTKEKTKKIADIKEYEYANSIYHIKMNVRTKKIILGKLSNPNIDTEHKKNLKELLSNYIGKISTHKKKILSLKK